MSDTEILYTSPFRSPSVTLEVAVRELFVNYLRFRPSQLAFGVSSLRVYPLGGLVLTEAFLLGFNTGYGITIGVRTAVD